MFAISEQKKKHATTTRQAITPSGNQDVFCVTNERAMAPSDSARHLARTQGSPHSHLAEIQAQIHFAPAHRHAFSKNAKQKFRREHSQFRYSPPPRLHVLSSENLNQNWVIPRNRLNTGSPQARNITKAQYNSHSALSQIQTGAHLEDLPEYRYVTYPQEQLQLQRERFRHKLKLQNEHLFEYHIPPT